jgi:hypothetical protein
VAEYWFTVAAIREDLAAALPTASVGERHDYGPAGCGKRTAQAFAVAVAVAARRSGGGR